MADRIRPRGDTAANWVAANPVLQLRELGFETDSRKFKVGDGASNWNALGYYCDLATTAVVTAAGTTTTLTAASAPVSIVNGSGGQTFKLPDATTVPVGKVFTFNNNQGSGTILVNNNSNTLFATIQSGGYCAVVLLDNSTAAGSWDKHYSAPANVSWSTNTLDYAGSITSATWNGNTVQPNKGGTGQSAFTGGQLLIGNTAGGLSKALLSAGSGIQINNGDGTIEIVNTGAAGSGVSIQAATARHTTAVPIATASTITNIACISGTNAVFYQSATSPLALGMSFNVAGITTTAVKAVDASVTCSFAGSFTGTTTLTVTAVSAGNLVVGQIISGGTTTGVVYISALGTGTGGVGTYTLGGAAQTVSNTATTAVLASSPGATLTASFTAANTLTITNVGGGFVALGQVISGGTTSGLVFISGYGTGTGGSGAGANGTYTTSGTAQPIGAAATSGAAVSSSVLATPATSSTIVASGIGYATGLTTMITTTTPAVDGRTMVANDIVFLQSQTATTCSGPWKIDSVGTGWALSRPSWFTGTFTGGQLVSIQQGSAFMGSVFLVAPTTPSPTSATIIGIDALTLTTAVTRAAGNATLANNVFSGSQTLRATGSAASNCPIIFTAPTVYNTIMTTPQAHALEWDGNRIFTTNSFSQRSGVRLLMDGLDSIQLAAFSGLTSAIISGIPTWARRLVISINGLTTSNGGEVSLTLGTAGNAFALNSLISSGESFTSTGRLVANSTFAMLLDGSASQTLIRNYVIQIDFLGSNLFGTSGTYSSKGFDSAGWTATAAGVFTLQGTITQLKAQVVSGTFTNGSIRLVWE